MVWKIIYDSLPGMRNCHGFSPKPSQANTNRDKLKF